MALHPAQTKKELTEQLRAAARRGDYLHLCELAERPVAHYAHLGFTAVCSVQERICKALAEHAAAPRAGEPTSATAARCLRLEADGALLFACKVVHKNRDGCAEAVEAGCELITAVLRGASQEMLTRAVTGRNALLPVVMDVVSRDFTAVPEEIGNESPAISYAMCCDALLAIAGLHRDAPPHALKPPARVVTYGHLQLLRRRVLGFPSSISSTLLDHTLWATDLLCMNEYAAGSSVKRALLKLLRSTGRVLRLLICLSLCSGTEQGVVDAKRLIMEVFDVVNDKDNVENWHLMRWVVVYVFLPLACAAQLPVETMAEDSVGPQPWVLPFTVSFCLGRCCIRRGGVAENWRETLVALLADEMAEKNPLSALEMTAMASSWHDCCVRPAAHLFTWLARGDAEFQDWLSNLDNAIDLPRTQVPSTRSRSRNNGASPSADADDDPDGGSDGERLSEWGSDNDDGEPPCITARTESTPALVARAMRALSGESREDIGARHAASEAAAAALLAELEAEPSKPTAASASGKKKKKKKKPAAKSAAAAKAAPASDAEEDSDGDDTAAAGQDDDEVAARELGARQAGVAGQAKAQPSSAPAVTVAQSALAPAAAPSAELSTAPRPAPVPAAAPRRAPAPGEAPSQPAPAAAPFQRRGRLGAASCGCGNAACAVPASHAPAAQAKEEDTRLEDLFPWLTVQTAQVPAQPADAAHEDDDLCVICLDEPRQMALSGCAAAHPPALCRGCAAQVLAGAAPVCPLCRAPAVPG